MPKKRIVLPKFEVRPGCIDINSIQVDACSKDLISFSVDTKQKRPIFTGFADPYSFYFGFDKWTQGVIHRKDLETRLQIRSDWWSEDDRDLIRMFCDPERYGFKCALIRIWDRKKAKQVDFKRIG